MIVLDSNVISALMHERPDGTVVDWLDRQASTSMWTTAVSVLEIRFGLARMPAGRRRVKLEQEFERLLSDDLQSRVLAFDQASAERTAALMARLEARGRTTELRDGMIAGIVFNRSASLATRNVKHFADTEIDVIDPWATVRRR
jgi:predicted nucleic acid-binding protein